ncbi:hypothetical protein [Rhizohabitans arisaemae]|uniref:hypothetical protein n=1 Tax=Rhizohabitans arisaemae TaxID=2720610 RepID=UPI0024B1F0D8|nr:hypothetical protein [Rhizohabitans arisaemae]
MRRWIMFTAVAVLVPIAGTAHASSGPSNPIPTPGAVIAALNAEFAKGAGVRFNETETYATVFMEKTLSASIHESSGVIKLSRTGISSFDKTQISDRIERRPTRTIVVDGTVYVRDSGLNSLIRPDVEWVSSPVEESAKDSWSAIHFDILAPGTLKNLLAKATFDRKTNSYRGTKRSPEISTDQINWTLWLGKDNLPKRFHTSYGPVSKFQIVVTNDIRFRNWGTPADITAPPAHLVTPSDELGGSLSQSIQETVNRLRAG